jgi:hypothetical protein
MITNLLKKLKPNNETKNVTTYDYKLIEKEKLLNSKSQSVLEYPIKSNFNYNTYTDNIVIKDKLNPLTLKSRK